MLQRLGEFFAESRLSGVVTAWFFESFTRENARTHSGINMAVLNRRTSNAASDATSHIVSGERLGEPRTNRKLFDRLEQAGGIETALPGTLHDLTGFQNILVHDCDTVNLGSGGTS